MSYNGSGTFVINTAGQPVVTGTVISSTAFNALTADLGTGLSTAITKDGQTATTARIPFVAGLSSALVTDTTSGSTGSIFTAGGIGIAKAVYVGTTATVAGTTDSSSTTTGAIITAGGAGVAKALFVGTTANVAGAVTLQSTLAVGGVATYSAQPIFSSLTASSAVATDASKGLVSVTNTGTGDNVLATSPTLVTPLLGTPTSGTLTNCTGLPNAGLVNSSVTVGSTAIALGATAATVAGLTLTTPIASTTIGVGGATASASGAGITFPATQSASSNANTLDDYEEGSWTPVPVPATGSITSYTSSGSYIKIGTNVIITGVVTLTNAGTGAGSLTFSGAPFTPATTAYGLIRETANFGTIYYLDVNTGTTVLGTQTAVNGALPITTNLQYTFSASYIAT
jgi:hypothetical protein